MDAILFGLATFAVICATPGPAVLAVVGTAMARGLAASLWLSLGLALALGVWGVLAAAGFGAVLSAAPQMLLAFKILGGAYLLWLAWKTGQSALRSRGQADGPTANGFKSGVLLNLSNPKSVFAWTATIAVGTPVEAPMLAWLLVPLAMLVTLLIYGLYGLAFSRPVMRTAYTRLRRWIDGVASGLFAVSGLALIRDGLVSVVRRT